MAIVRILIDTKKYDVYNERWQDKVASIITSALSTMGDDIEAMKLRDENGNECGKITVEER